MTPGLIWFYTGAGSRGCRQRGDLSQKRRKIAEFRPRVRSVLLSLYLPYEMSDLRIARTLPAAADRIVHLFKLTSPAQIDDQLGEWLAEAYDFNTD